MPQSARKRRIFRAFQSSRAHINNLPRDGILYTSLLSPATPVTPSDRGARRITRVAKLGWNKCGYKDCQSVENFQEKGPHRCSNCKRGLEVEINPAGATFEIPTLGKVEYARSVSCPHLYCDGKTTSFRSGKQNCEKCHRPFHVEVEEPILAYRSYRSNW